MRGLACDGDGFRLFTSSSPSSQSCQAQGPAGGGCSFDSISVVQAGFFSKSLSSGLTPYDMLAQVSEKLASAEQKAETASNMIRPQRVRMLAEASINDLQHARELNAEVQHNINQFGLGSRSEEEASPWPVALLGPAPLKRTGCRRRNCRRRTLQEFL
eukprot:TRINITY_DN107881_c0_g1_i1.p1 TRINITY_DN107881_c0_g1~~TRINITY_DN107881_c0_g1_i1.p1  ORF type:complete len:158 (-),score=31.43 TRINITY_DN107881_c0_g1_i1:602-1075(-)